MYKLGDTLHTILHLALFILYNQSSSLCHYLVFKNAILMTPWYFIVWLYQNLCSQFSICRHLGGFLFFMIINGAVANILVQEIFIWVSDNGLRRNSPKGNYGVPALLFGTSVFTNALGKWVTPVTPLNWWPLLLPLRPRQEDLLFMSERDAKGAPAASPGYLPEPTPCKAEFPLQEPFHN